MSHFNNGNHRHADIDNPSERDQTEDAHMSLVLVYNQERAHVGPRPETSGIQEGAVGGTAVFYRNEQEDNPVSLPPESFQESDGGISMSRQDFNAINNPAHPRPQQYQDRYGVESVSGMTSYGMNQPNDHVSPISYDHQLAQENYSGQDYNDEAHGPPSLPQTSMPLGATAEEMTPVDDFTRFLRSFDNVNISETEKRKLAQQNVYYPNIGPGIFRCKTCKKDSHIGDQERHTDICRMRQVANTADRDNRRPEMRGNVPYGESSVRRDVPLMAPAPDVRPVEHNGGPLLPPRPDVRPMLPQRPGMIDYEQLGARPRIPTGGSLGVYREYGVEPRQQNTPRISSTPNQEQVKTDEQTRQAILPPTLENQPYLQNTEYVTTSLPLLDIDQSGIRRPPLIRVLSNGSNGSNGSNDSFNTASEGEESGPSSLLARGASAVPPHQQDSHNSEKETMIVQLLDMGFQEERVQNVMDGNKSANLTVEQLVDILTACQVGVDSSSCARESSGRNLKKVVFKENICKWCEDDEDVEVTCHDCGCMICIKCARKEKSTCQVCGTPIVYFRQFDPLAKFKRKK